MGHSSEWTPDGSRNIMKQYPMQWLKNTSIKNACSLILSGDLMEAMTLLRCFRCNGCRAQIAEGMQSDPAKLQPCSSIAQCAVRSVVLSFDQFMVVWTRALDKIHPGSVTMVL